MIGKFFHKFFKGRLWFGFEIFVAYGCWVPQHESFHSIFDFSLWEGIPGQEEWRS